MDRRAAQAPGSPRLSRRRFIDLMGAGFVGLFAGGLAIAQEDAAGPMSPPNRPGDPGWPSSADWDRLNESVNGRLVRPVSPVQACKVDSNSAACQVALQNIENPFYLSEQAGATQSTGWANAWASAPSPYAVAAESADDVAAAVKFAREHRLRLVVKGTGHDYLGRSTDANALLIWTHRMRGATYLDDFVAEGAPAGSAPAKALTVYAGTRWLDAYTEATTRHGRYVQGGGCTTVGAAGGFTQGGGFGSFSKKYGTGAASVLEVEVVTAGNIKADSDEAFRALIERFVEFYEVALNNEHWGEQFAIRPDNSIEIVLLFQGLSEKEVASTWAPLKHWLKQDAAFSHELEPIFIPARDMWNFDYWKENHPELVELNSDPGHGRIEYWWAPNSAEVSAFCYTYQSRWIPIALFRKDARKDFADQLFAASRHWPLAMHINKGLAGAAADAVQRGKQTSTHPGVYDAAALLILVARKKGVYPGIPGLEPDLTEAEEKAGSISVAMLVIRAITPGAGTYANEADFFEKNWQEEFWGPHYARLLQIKKRYDPDGMFRCHHSVGSELPA